jgi:hypothetical protein
MRNIFLQVAKFVVLRFSFKIHEFTTHADENLQRKEIIYILIGKGFSFELHNLFIFRLILTFKVSN